MGGNVIETEGGPHLDFSVVIRATNYLVLICRPDILQVCFITFTESCLSLPPKVETQKRMCMLWKYFERVISGKNK